MKAEAWKIYINGSPTGIMTDSGAITSWPTPDAAEAAANIIRDRESQFVADGWISHPGIVIVRRVS